MLLDTPVASGSDLLVLESRAGGRTIGLLQMGGKAL